MSVSIGPNLSSREQEADTYVNKIADRFRRRGIRVTTQVRRGDAPYEIKKGAIDWKVDAIVISFGYPASEASLHRGIPRNALTDLVHHERW